MKWKVQMMITFERGQLLDEHINVVQTLVEVAIIERVMHFLTMCKSIYVWNQV